MPKSIYNKTSLGRICPKCKEWKTREEMGTDPRSVSGMSSRCKACSTLSEQIRRTQNKSQGKCLQCSHPHLEGHQLCAKHRDNMLKRQQVEYKRRLDQRLCAKCTAPAAEGKVHCEQCLKDAVLPRKQFLAEKRASGICSKCDEPSLLGKTFCEKHLHRHNEGIRTMYRRRVETGLCKDCGNPRDEGGNDQHCFRCRIIRLFSASVRDALKVRGVNKRAVRGVYYDSLPKSEELIPSIKFWAELQGIDPAIVEIHHIIPKSEVDWKVPGDSEWNFLWSIDNLLPVTTAAHDAIHRGDFENIHPEVIMRIKKMQERKYAES